MTHANQWVAAYIRAWTSNAPDEIADLFAEDACYRPTPFSPGWSGRAAIVEGWLERKDDPGTWTFEYDLLCESPSTVVVRATVVYDPPYPEFANIWLVRFGPDGRCNEFTEWWMSRPQTAEPPNPGTAPEAA